MALRRRFGAGGKMSRMSVEAKQFLFISSNKLPMEADVVLQDLSPIDNVLCVYRRSANQNKSHTVPFVLSAPPGAAPSALSPRRNFTSRISWKFFARFGGCC